MSNGGTMDQAGVRMRKPYGQRAAAYGDGGSAAGVSGLTGISSPQALGSMSGLARFGGGSSGFQPRTYTPGRYQPRGMSLNLGSPAAGTPGATGRTGMTANDGGMGAAQSTTPGEGFGFSATPGQIGRGLGIAGAVAGIPGLGMLSNATGLSRGISNYGAANNNPNYSNEGRNSPGMGGGVSGDTGLGQGETGYGAGIGGGYGGGLGAGYGGLGGPDGGVSAGYGDVGAGLGGLGAADSSGDGSGGK